LLRWLSEAYFEITKQRRYSTKYLRESFFVFSVRTELVVLRQAQHKRIKTVRPELVEGWFDRLTINGETFI
jgi:hypothetical protein